MDNKIRTQKTFFVSVLMVDQAEPTEEVRCATQQAVVEGKRKNTNNSATCLF